MPEYKFVDRLQEYTKELVTKAIEKGNLPAELKNIPKDKLIYGITDQATPILRKIENDAVDAGIERFASLVRYSLNSAKPKKG